MAIDLAIVLGFTGVMKSRPSAKAWAIGEQPSAWAPLKRTCFSSTSPTLMNSSKPLRILVNREPEARGATMWSGSCQPSCSITS